MAKIQGILSCVILMMVEIDLNIHQNEYVAHVAQKICIVLFTTLRSWFLIYIIFIDLFNFLTIYYYH